MPEAPVEIDASLVRRLVGRQFPRWGGLPVRPVSPGGWDNRTFRLGERLSVRLPSAGRYVAQVAKEHRWLPALAPRLPLPIPEPVALGRPGEGYPWPWSVYGWLDGESAQTARIDDPVALAVQLARFLAALQAAGTADAPPPGAHNFFRGGAPATRDAETREAIASLGTAIDAHAATSCWTEALATTWTGPPVWVHGDVSAGNVLVRHGRLAAVIDFGGLAIGDPACDLTIAWTLFHGESREAFRTEVAADDATWSRARGWALWKALITIAEHELSRPAKASAARRVLETVLAEHDEAR